MDILSLVRGILGLALINGFIIKGASVCPTKIFAVHDNDSAPLVPIAFAITQAIA